MDRLSTFLPKVNISTCILDPTFSFLLMSINAMIIFSLLIKRRLLLYFHMPHCKCPFLHFSWHQNSLEEFNIAAFTPLSMFFGWLKNPPKIEFNYRKWESGWRKSKYRQNIFESYFYWVPVSLSSILINNQLPISPRPHIFLFPFLTIKRILMFILESEY
jgi:hypothetical protein